MKRLFLTTVVCATLLTPLPIRSEVVQISPRLYSAGVPRQQFNYYAAPLVEGRQRQSNWCWAATIQMVLNYHGLYVSQEQIVARVFGNLVNQPGSPDNIMRALSGWAPDTRGRFSQIQALPYNIRGSDVVNDLAYRWPLIVGLRQPGGIGHAYVLTAVTYAVGANNQPIFQSAILRDPWPSNPSRIQISWNEFQSRLIFVTRVHVKRL
jgi:hypothetical protein